MLTVLSQFRNDDVLQIALGDKLGWVNGYCYETPIAGSPADELQALVLVLESRPIVTGAVLKKQGTAKSVHLLWFLRSPF